MASQAGTGTRVYDAKDWPPPDRVLRLSRLDEDARIDACRQWIESQGS